MICDTEELLLLVQNWITESATVMFSLILTDSPRDPALGVRLRGRIVGIDPSLPGFSFGIEDEPAIIVNLQSWNIGFAEGKEIPLPAGDNISECFTLSRPNPMLSLWTLAAG